jgi:hypothetical protein
MLPRRQLQGFVRHRPCGTTILTLPAGAQNTKQPSRSSRQSKGTLTPDTKLSFSTREAHSSSNQASRRSMIWKPQTEPHNFRKQTKSNRLAFHPHPSSPDEIDTQFESVGTRAKRLRAIGTSKRKIKATWRSVSQETRCRTKYYTADLRCKYGYGDLIRCS